MSSRASHGVATRRHGADPGPINTGPRFGDERRSIVLTSESGGYGSRVGVPTTLSRCRDLPGMTAEFVLPVGAMLSIESRMSLSRSPQGGGGRDIRVLTNCRGEPGCRSRRRRRGVV
ncbi:Doubtful CDS [Bradyrhizobium sp. ORS 285]|nr:Doubtful CDS [Bradyrhizobium sp. ORS 285]